MAVFNWEYLSFVSFDTTWIYREVLLLPVLIVGLWFLWMRIVKATLKDESGLPKAVDLSEAYQEAIIQDALSTDDSSDDEDGAKPETDTAAEAEATKKEDLNAKKDD